MYEGMCLGGPMNGEFGQSRFPKGFLLVDKSTNRCWLYDWSPESGTFAVRDEEAMEVSKQGRIRAANESDYDVVAAPWVGAL